MMIQLQASPFLRQEMGRTLPSLNHNQQDRHRLEGLADAAFCLQDPGLYSPAGSPSSPDFKEYTFAPGHSIPASTESKPYGIPSIQNLFAIADGHRPRSYGFDPPRPEPGFRRPSTGSESSFQGSFASVPELSRPSTASPPPRLVPRTPEAHHAITPVAHLNIKLRLSDLADEMKWLEQLNRRILLPARRRRPSSRQAPYSTTSSARGRRGSSNPGVRAETPPRDKQQKEPHFNLRYPKSVKLFILYYKEDCGWGWEAINKRRVDLLPVLYRDGYKPEIEEKRKVAGINGFYYRLNEVMPALAPDGASLRFVEHGGRSWELTEPSKCREGPCRGEEKRKGGARGGKTREDAEARPRGMVDRYPEEVVYHWDEFVKHFVPPARHAEIYARAKSYCEIRAEQRRENGVPQWAPDNEEERVRHTNPPNAKGRSPKAKDGETDEVLSDLMCACDLAPEME
ncbi:hypothetical protein UCDDA912_g04098 [Diaporthe ampelina]|uniref:Uncharacterized protein n=1 Tax=Diaporthe ampelina TaxID=1214573 RepID=A0A0G2FPP3_9PEZI|nr:hypothetical protein UCDDA912_g04098 [Diaporthe ampelina]